MPCEPVDPQVGQFPAASVIKAVEQKPISEVDDQTLILADVGRRALDQVHGTVVEILGRPARTFAERAAEGRPTPRQRGR